MKWLNIFWEAIGEYSNQIIALAALSTAVIAYLGIRIWKKQLIGSSRYKKAKELLLAVNIVQEDFKRVRAPMIYTYEYPEEKINDEGKIENRNDYKDMLYVYSNRMQKLLDSFQKLEKNNLEALVEWGKGYNALILPIRKCFYDLKDAIHNYLEQLKPGFDFHKKKIKEDYVDIIYSSSTKNKPDKFSKEIEDAVGLFEDWLRPYIEKRRWYNSFKGK